MTRAIYDDTQSASSALEIDALEAGSAVSSPDHDTSQIVAESDSVPSEARDGQPQVRDPDRFTGHGVKLRIFEGPLDLLLYLIRAHRYDIFDIPIQEVTNQFLEFLKLMEEVDIEYAGDFLVTAATLMQIKSRMLLPKQESANEEEIEEEGDDPRQKLVERLLEYQRYQEAAGTLQILRDERANLFPRPPLIEGLTPLEGDLEPDQLSESLMLQNVSTFDLLKALQKVLDRVAEPPVAIIHREPFTLGERIRGVLRRLSAIREDVAFSALCDDCETRLEVVITFLALLELIRRGRVMVVQKQNFDEIWARERKS